MFYRKQSNQYIHEGHQFVIDGFTYPAQWLYQATAEQKAALGLEEVEVVNSPANAKFYWVSEELNGATLTYVNTPKDLDQVKTAITAELKQTAYNLLFPSDWMVVRAAETQTPLDENWKNYRQEIRDKTAQYINQVEAAADVDAIAEMVFQWPDDPTV